LLTLGPVDRPLRPVQINVEYSRRVDDLAIVVTAAQRGDRKAFAELYRRFSRAVHGVILARAPYREAADLVQDTFAIVLERLPQLAEAAAFPGWLLAIARNRAIDHMRGRKPTEELAEIPVAASRAAEVAQVLAALRELPEAYHETMILRLVEGLSGPEIADQTGLSPGSVRVNLHRGMKLLRERLGITNQEASDERVG
jgi:RNA polymerase sigma-70 factor (ECF subfamily)